MEKVYKKQLIETLKLARDEVKKPFTWVKGTYQSEYVLRQPNSAEAGSPDARGVVVESGEYGVYKQHDLSHDFDGMFRMFRKQGEQINCVCAIGAVQKAVGNDRFGAKSRLYDRVIETLIAALPKSYLTSAKCGGEPAVEQFNDLKTTTQRQVVAVFTRAIKALEGGV